MATRQFVALVSGALLVLALVGCASGEPSVMPELTGKQLDVAKSDIERAGHGGEVEIVGGGLFGVVDDSNWIVCEQSPVAGAVISNPRLVVDRECGDGASATPQPTVSPEPSASALPADVIDIGLADLLDRLNSNDLVAGEVYRFDAELMDREQWSASATGLFSVMVKAPGSAFADNQDYYVLVDEASQAADWVPGSVMTFVVENVELNVNGYTSSGWFKVLSAQPAE